MPRARKFTDLDQSTSIQYRPPESEREKHQMFRLRHQVFLTELGREREEETDEYDESAQHVVAVQAGEVVGTLRLYKLPADTVDVKIGRVAVRKDLRGQGIGRELMRAAHLWAAAQGFRSCYLHAETGVRAFYEGLGYLAEGDIFEEAGAPHICMRRPS